MHIIKLFYLVSTLSQQYILGLLEGRKRVVPLVTLVYYGLTFTKRGSHEKFAITGYYRLFFCFLPLQLLQSGHGLEEETILRKCLSQVL